jgi:hypothetical protein
MSDRASLRQVAALMAYAGDHGWLPAAVQTRRCRGWRWSARRVDRRLSAQRVIFFVAIILDAALTVPNRWRCDCIVLILCGLFFIADNR